MRIPVPSDPLPSPETPATGAEALSHRTSGRHGSDSRHAPFSPCGSLNTCRKRAILVAGISEHAGGHRCGNHREVQARRCRAALSAVVRGRQRGAPVRVCARRLRLRPARRTRPAAGERDGPAQAARDNRRPSPARPRGRARGNGVKSKQGKQKEAGAGSIIDFSRAKTAYPDSLMAQPGNRPPFLSQKKVPDSFPP